jgi:hypothetical protein
MGRVLIHYSPSTWSVRFPVRTLLIGIAVAVTIATVAVIVYRLHSGDTDADVFTNGLMTATAIAWYSAISYRNRTSLSGEMRRMRVDRVLRAVEQAARSRGRGGQ